MSAFANHSLVGIHGALQPPTNDGVQQGRCDGSWAYQRVGTKSSIVLTRQLEFAPPGSHVAGLHDGLLGKPQEFQNPRVSKNAMVYLVY